jgi:ABC-type Zn uptake system ZnuABC Zn-binding protein ZnuA
MSRFILPCLLIVPLLQGCTRASDPWAAAKPGQKRVLASFPPLYSMTAAVAGDDAYVLSLFSNQGPHDVKDGPKDMLKLVRADLIIMNGLGLDDGFMDRLIDGSRNKAPVLRVGDRLPEALKSADKEHKHDHDHAGHHHHHHGAVDPHVWLGPPQAIAIVQSIARQLADIDPAHKAGYEKRSAAFVSELEKLQADGKALFAGKKSRNIVTMHESLGYFARAFDLDIKGSLQLQPGVDPNPATLAKLADACKKDGVSVIAVEPQYDAKLARTLQQHLERSGRKVQLVEVDPIETAPLAADSPNPEPDFYLRKMRQNIETLARALP